MVVDIRVACVAIYKYSLDDIVNVSGPTNYLRSIRVYPKKTFMVGFVSLMTNAVSDIVAIFINGERMEKYVLIVQKIPFLTDGPTPLPPPLKIVVDFFGVDG